MNDFVMRRNIQRYRDLLETVADDSNRRVLLTLLAEEEAKLAEWQAQHQRAAE